ncbi:DUF1223 domain-containing protein [Thioclava sp. GXIMD4216]|uniref:DUF1223 domain-containing protein n=1 Tax=unclassified Thioclava TaxID=2621713 RepID=UPI0030CCB3C5
MTTAQVDHLATKRKLTASPLRLAMVVTVSVMLGSAMMSPAVWAQDMSGAGQAGAANRDTDPQSGETTFSDTAGPDESGFSENDEFGATAGATAEETAGQTPSSSDAPLTDPATAVAAATAPAGVDVSKGTSPVVVELFTSQGCAACPPADKLLEGLAERDDVIALALHVDYWDYLGWRDPFGQPAFTSRQKGYARAVKERMIYTPQMIVNGQQRLLGADRVAIKSALDTATASTAPVDIAISQEGDQYRISLSANPPLGHDAMVQVVRYLPHASVDILRGENAGLSMDYTNIVTQWHIVADWDGQTPMTFDTQVEGSNPAVVIVQTSQPGRSVPLPGAIVGAARIK